MNHLQTTWRLFSSSIFGRPGMSNTERFAAAGLKLLAISVLAVWTVMAVYFWKFAPGHWFELSSNGADWNNFGTFFGGMLGPFFGFLAFGGVLFTVVLQAQQIDSASERGELEEIQRVMASLWSRIDDGFQKQPCGDYRRFEHIETPRTLFDVLRGVGNTAIEELSHNTARSEGSRRINNAMYDLCRQELQQTRVDFNSLGWCISRFKAKGGSADVVTFYVDRYVVPVMWLYALAAPLDEHVVEAFKPDQTLKAVLASESAQEHSV